MPSYSHSKLGTFQNCKYKYKLQYIDRVKVSVPTTIEAFMGAKVHEALEKLYKDLQHQKMNAKEELLAFFEKRWNEDWDKEILIVKKEYTAEHYRAMGNKFISDYYDHYTPFNHLRTIGVETEERLSLSDGNSYHIRIDRLSCDASGNYYICDYKTNNSLKAQEELDSDRQLAMYSLWVKQNFKDARKVYLLWYFLAFDKEMISERNDAQLETLKKDVQTLIKEIESCVDFPTTVNALCNYCVYKSICPAWKHEFAVVEEVPVALDGQKLADTYASLDAEEKRIALEKEEVKEKLINFATQENVSAVFGTQKKISIKEYSKVVFPEDKKEFVSLIKKKGLYDECSSVNYMKLSSKIAKKEIDQDIINLTTTEKGYRLSVGKRKE